MSEFWTNGLSVGDQLACRDLLSVPLRFHLLYLILLHSSSISQD